MADQPLLDRLVGTLSPSWAARRARARAITRAMSSLTGGRGGYRSARKNRLNDSWMPLSHSADTAILYDLEELRRKSRDLVRNNAYAQVIGAIADHVVGSGLRPYSRVRADALGIDSEQAEAFQNAAEDVFDVWSPVADVRGQLSFGQLQRLAYRTMLEDGEAFVRRVQLPESVMTAHGLPFSTAYEMVDADRVCSPNRRVVSRLPNGHTMRLGVEVNGFGRPVFYWVLKDHPAERQSLSRSADAFVRVPAKEINHLYRPIRPGQTRGVPHLSPDLDTFYQLDELFKFELVTAQVVACHSLFITKKNADDYGPGLPGETTSDGDREQYVEPGLVTYLGEGEEPHNFNPNRPGNTFPPFVHILLQKLAAGTSVTYEHISRDFSKANFSSGRLAQQMARKFFGGEQELVKLRVAQPAWRDVQREAYLAERLMPARRHQITDQNEALYLHAGWSGPGYGYVDPVKEITAAGMAVDLNLSTLADECAAVGKDWREVIDQRAKEIKYAERRGVEMRSVSTIAQVNVNAGEDEPTTRDEESIREAA